MNSLGKQEKFYIFAKNYYKSFSIEGISTQNAERYGWNLGVKQTSGLKTFINMSLTSASIFKRLKRH